jgi:predicted transcriptional regulator
MKRDEVCSVVATADVVSCELTLEQEDALEESIEQIARGEFVTARELFDELREMRERASRGRSSPEV